MSDKKNINLDFESRDLKSVGYFYIFAKYIFPFVLYLIGILVLIGIVVNLLNNYQISFESNITI